MIKPKDCILAIGFSTDSNHLMSEVTVQHKDFAKSIKRGTKLNTQALYKKIAEFTALYRSNICDIKGVGGTVLENFTAANLRLLPPCKILTLMSHFKPPTILPEDLIDTNELHLIINSRPDLFADYFTKLPESVKAEELIIGFNLLIKDETFFFRAGLSTFITEHEELKLPEIYIKYLNRIALEKIFPKALAKGCLVELYDGLYSVKDIVNMIPESFTGIIDLSICHSIIVQDELKKVQPQRHAFATEEPLRLDFKIIFYKGLMQKLNAEQKDYVSAYFELIKELKNKL